uniref:Uncharacterized protein n=1 Tax=viral metagenome TaxID=1070528 RepID=A0A6C0EA87_9ZZZZ
MEYLRNLYNNYKRKKLEKLYDKKEEIIWKILHDKNIPISSLFREEENGKMIFYFGYHYQMSKEQTDILFKQVKDVCDSEKLYELNVDIRFLKEATARIALCLNRPLPFYCCEN